MSREAIREFFKKKWEWMGLVGGYKVTREAGFCPEESKNSVIYENTLENGEVINLFDEFGYGVVIYTAYGDTWHYFISREEILEIKYNPPKIKSWLILSTPYQKKIEKYMELVGRFRKDPLSLSLEEKRWVLENANLPTDLAPKMLWDKYFDT